MLVMCTTQKDNDVVSLFRAVPTRPLTCKGGSFRTQCPIPERSSLSKAECKPQLVLTSLQSFPVNCLVSPPPPQTHQRLEGNSCHTSGILTPPGEESAIIPTLRQKQIFVEKLPLVRLKEA